MKLWIDKEELIFAQMMIDEARTRPVIFHTFRTKDNDSEVEVDVEVKE